MYAYRPFIASCFNRKLLNIPLLAGHHIADIGGMRWRQHEIGSLFNPFESIPSQSHHPTFCFMTWWHFCRCQSTMEAASSPNSRTKTKIIWPLPRLKSQGLQNGEILRSAMISSYSWVFWQALGVDNTLHLRGAWQSLQVSIHFDLPQFKHFLNNHPSWQTCYHLPTLCTHAQQTCNSDNALKWIRVLDI